MIACEQTQSYRNASTYAVNKTLQIVKIRGLKPWFHVKIKLF